MNAMEALEQIADHDDAPMTLRSLALSAHILDFHYLGEKLFATDLAAENAKSGATSLKHMGRSGAKVIVKRIKRLRRFGFAEDDVVVFAQAYFRLGADAADSSISGDPAAADMLNERKGIRK